MNIFALSPNPIESASFHCDQHIHKMILESAQLLSTAVWMLAPHKAKNNYKIYKPSYQNHPCAVWVREKQKHADYVISLACGLEDIRLSLGHNPHASIEVISEAARALFEVPGKSYTPPDHFALAMPIHISLNPTFRTDVERYQAYYRYKAKLWELQGKKMTWNGRTIPPFLQGTEK